jgi:F0F1-type ATP synthase assembly protein I
MSNSGQKHPPRLMSDAQVAGLMAQSGCLAFGMVLATVVGGIWLDRLLNTRPLMTLLLVLGSVPVTIFLLFRIAMRAVANSRTGGRDQHERDDQA